MKGKGLYIYSINKLCYKTTRQTKKVYKNPNNLPNTNTLTITKIPLCPRHANSGGTFYPFPSQLSQSLSPILS